MSAEKNLQESIIHTLKKTGYEYLGSHLPIDGTVLDSNFKTQFERLNAEALQGKTLTDTEYKRLKNAFPKNAREAYRILREGVQFILDNNEKVTCKLYDNKNNENNVYQVAQEVKAEGATTSVRLDLVLFINGIPFSNMELKSLTTSRGTAEAVSQINRYTAEGIYRKGLLRFIQYYSVSNDATTQYFAMNSLVDLGTLISAPYGSQLFRWTDKDNKPSLNAETFVKDFYSPYMTFNIITNYMLLLPLGKGILILRPYQIYAVEASIKRTLEGENSLIWHSTGSGKTCTSFILAKTMIETTPNKVVLLLDRNDLADQTMKEYRKFDISGMISSAIFKGRDLHKALTDDQQKLVITTIQSYNKWVQRYTKTVKRLSNQPTTFVIDEAHRSTFGDMFSRIRSGFPQSTFIGFTGTPIMEDNSGEHDLTTAHLFGDPSHTYNIKNAIDDGNVLPFKVQETGNLVPLNGELEYTKEYYRNPVRIRAHAEFIAKNLHKHTQQGDPVKNIATEGFTAMLATDGKPSAVSYWETTTPLLKAQNRRTAIIFSVEENAEFMLNGKVEHEKIYYTKILQAWDDIWGTKYAEGAKTDFETMVKAYNSAVITKAKEGEIDLLIVSDMLLTGFDAPGLNTLYLDKNLRYHTLLQAMSRTNRTKGVEKRVGNIITFQDRDMKEDINATIKLYSGGHPITDILDRDSYMEIIRELEETVPVMRGHAPTAQHVLEIHEMRELLDFASELTNIRKLLSLARLYTEWEEKHYDRIGINKGEIDMYYACLQEARNKLTDYTEDDDETMQDGLLEIDMNIQEAGYYIINVAYITNLLHAYVESPPEAKQQWIDRAERSLRASDNAEVIKMREALEEAVDACKRGEVHSVDELTKRVRKARRKLEKRKTISLSEKYGLPVEKLEEWVDFYMETDRHDDSILTSIKTHFPNLKYRERSSMKRNIQAYIKKNF